MCTRGGALCLLFVLYGACIWCWWPEQVSPHGDNNWLSPRPASQWASERRLSQHQSGRCTRRIRTKLCIQIRTDEWLRSLSSVMRFRNGRTPGIPESSSSCRITNQTEDTSLLAVSHLCLIPLYSLFAVCRVSDSVCRPCHRVRVPTVSCHAISAVSHLTKF